MYKPKHKRPDKFHFDLMVIGTGSGGGVAAHIAAKAGKRVAVVEAEKMGGECPNFGCVPTKALLQAAEVYETALAGKQFGIDGSKTTYDYAKVKAWKDATVMHTGTTEGEEIYEHAGIAVIKGWAHFLSPWTVSVHGRRYNSKNFLIATGTKSVVPPIPGLKEAGYITYREAIELTSPPKSLFVIGGGAIGCEFAQLFSTFGTKVTIADFAPRLIPLEDPEVGMLLEALFERRGIRTITEGKVVRIEKSGSAKKIYIERNGEVIEVEADEIMLSSGKAPNTDMGLENAGVEYDRGGVKVNPFMQTSNKHVYASGDVVGPYRFTHTAAYQSRIAAHNMFHRKRKKAADYHAIPRCVFVTPEIACVGLTEQQLKEKGVAFRVGAAPIDIIGRSNTSAEDNGFVKVLATPKGKLLGASIVSPRAGEMIHELTLAIQHGMTASDITDTVHAFPTWSEAVRHACLKLKSS